MCGGFIRRSHDVILPSTLYFAGSHKVLGHSYGTFSAPDLGHLVEPVTPTSLYPNLPQREHYHPEFFQSLPTDINCQVSGHGAGTVPRPCIHHDGSVKRKDSTGVTFAPGITTTASTENLRRIPGVSPTGTTSTDSLERNRNVSGVPSTGSLENIRQSENRSSHSEIIGSRCSCHSSDSLLNYYGQHSNSIEKLQNPQSIHRTQEAGPSRQTRSGVNSSQDNSLARQNILNWIDTGMAQFYEGTSPQRHLVDRWVTTI